MKKYQALMTEAKAKLPVIYHSTLTSAIAAAEKYAKESGYTLDAEELATRIGLGPAKPSKGKTNRYTLSLYKDGKKVKQGLSAQVYNRGVSGNTFELNAYIS